MKLRIHSKDKVYESEPFKPGGDVECQLEEWSTCGIPMTRCQNYGVGGGAGKDPVRQPTIQSLISDDRILPMTIFRQMISLAGQI